MSFLGMPPDVVSKIFLSTAILGGAVMCFFGLRLFKAVLCLAGLVIGATVAAYIGMRYALPAEQVPPFTYAGLITVMRAVPEQTVVLVCAVVGGIGGALLAGLVHHAGVFLLGAWLGQIVAEFTMAGSSDRSRIMVLAILALIGGVLAMIMRKTITIISTAVIGSCGLMFGMYALLKRFPAEEAVKGLQRGGNDLYVMLGCAGVLAAIGVYVQFTMAPEEKKEEPVYKKVKKSKHKKGEE